MLLMYRPCTLTEEHGGNVQKPALLRHHIYKVLLTKLGLFKLNFALKLAFARSLCVSNPNDLTYDCILYNAIAPYFKVKKL